MSIKAHFLSSMVSKLALKALVNDMVIVLMLFSQVWSAVVDMPAMYEVWQKFIPRVSRLSLSIPAYILAYLAIKFIYCIYKTHL